MRSIEYPLITARCRPSRSGALFLLPDREIKVTAPRELLRKIVQLCDGMRTCADVLRLLADHWPPKALALFINELCNCGVLVDAYSQSRSVWTLVKNPPPFSRTLTHGKVVRLLEKAKRRHRVWAQGIVLTPAKQRLAPIIQARMSVRSFARTAVSLDKIAAILWAAYGTIVHSAERFPRRTVPSGGGLYPLRLSLILCKRCGSAEPGIYDVSFDLKGKVVLRRVNAESAAGKQSFLDQLLLEDAAGIVVVSGAFCHTEEKYGNRALLYVPLEAGHVAQNALLAATEFGLGSVEIGGFVEDALSKSLRLPCEYVPLTTIVFGIPNTSESEVGRGLEVTWAVGNATDYKLPFSMAFARPLGDGRDWSCGRAESSRVAYRKATAEAWEWRACGVVNKDKLVRARFNEIRNCVPPTAILRFHPAQYRCESFPNRLWNVGEEALWVSAECQFSGRTYLMLADLVFFPYRVNERKYANANSSGAAAYPSWDGAVQRGAFELVERDAFMISWLNRLPGARIPLNALPAGIRKRVNELVRLGFKIDLQDIGFDLVSVPFVIAQNKTLTFTTCSAACSLEVEAALDKALMEVEASVYCKLLAPTGNANSMTPRRVRLTLDHGALYEQPRWYTRANFFFSPQRETRLSAMIQKSPKTWNDFRAKLLAQRRTILAVDLGSAENGGLKVAKVFIPGLVSMSFGYGEEPCGMERIYKVPITLEMQSRQKDFRGLNKFPHPYT